LIIFDWFPRQQGHQKHQKAQTQPLEPAEEQARLPFANFLLAASSFLTYVR